MIIIDTNSLVILVLGLMNPNIINQHPRTSIYDKSDFYFLIEKIGDLDNLVILPNIWTELDNLLNKFSGNLKDQYVNKLKQISKLSTEEYISSEKGMDFYSFHDLGLTDSLILNYATSSKCEYVITSDSKLSYHLLAHGVNVIDLVKIRNSKYLD
jgi:rRNA-processing protein FCF1